MIDRQRWLPGSRARELASDSRAGFYARANAMRQQRAWMRSRAPLLAAAAALMSSPLLVVPLIPGAFTRGVMVGAVMTVVPGALWFLTVLNTGTTPLMMGNDAERWSAQELRKLIRRQRPKQWVLINRVPLEGVDIDHLLLGPAGVVVVETKWSAATWQTDERVPASRAVHGAEQRVAAAVSQVQSTSRRIRLWRPVKRWDLPVHAAVVLWGGRPGDHVPMQPRGDVMVLHGRDLTSWVAGLPGAGTATSAAIESVRTAIDAFIDERERREPSLVETPTSGGRYLAALAIGVATALSSFAFALLSLTWTSSWAVGGSAAVALAALGIGLRRIPKLRAVAAGMFTGVAAAVALGAVALAYYGS